jgi:uncharacterized protein (DUF1499 family)
MRVVAVRRDATMVGMPATCEGSHCRGGVHYLTLAACCPNAPCCYAQTALRNWYK